MGMLSRCLSSKSTSNFTMIMKESCLFHIKQIPPSKPIRNPVGTLPCHWWTDAKKEWPHIQRNQSLGNQQSWLCFCYFGKSQRRNLCVSSSHHWVSKELETPLSSLSWLQTVTTARNWIPLLSITEPYIYLFYLLFFICPITYTICSTVIRDRN